LSDISWNVPGEEAIRNYKKGEEVETVVLAVDAERERISLGIKQLEKDPFSSYVAEYPKGSVVKGTVEKVEPKEVILRLAEGVEGQLCVAELTKEGKVEDAATILKPGDEVEAKLIGLDRKQRIIMLSIKARETDEEAATVQEYSADAAGTTKLGDILKEQLDSK